MKSKVSRHLLCALKAQRGAALCAVWVSIGYLTVMLIIYH